MPSGPSGCWAAAPTNSRTSLASSADAASLFPSCQHVALRRLLRRHRLPQQLGRRAEARVDEGLADPLRILPPSVQVDVVPVGVRQMDGVFPAWKASRSSPPGRTTRANSAKSSLWR